MTSPSPAMFRSGDWIRGEYTVAGEDSRAFYGLAFTGFDRGGSAASIQGTWMPMGEDPDLPATFSPDADGMFDDIVALESPLGALDCAFTGTIVAVNPAFNAYQSNPVIDCDLLAFGGEGNEDEVEMFMSVMDAPDMPGMGTRAVVFSILPREVNELALGSLYELTRE